MPGGSTPDTVTFGNAIGSSTATVTLDGNWAVGSLTFNTTGGGSYTISRSAGDTTSTLDADRQRNQQRRQPHDRCAGRARQQRQRQHHRRKQLDHLRANKREHRGSSLTKTDAGALILAGSNIYSGGTEVDGGILVAANGSNGSATGSGSVTLNGGTLASGTSGGSISGSVQAGSGASEIAPGGVGSIGKLTIGSLLTSSNLTLNFDLTTPGGSGDLLTITNGLTVGPDTPITFGTNPTATGDYPLIGGSFGTPNLGNFDLPAAPVGETYSLADRGGATSTSWLCPSLPPSSCWASVRSGCWAGRGGGSGRRERISARIGLGNGPGPGALGGGFGYGYNVAWLTLPK